jgi:hypothetical protein
MAYQKKVVSGGSEKLSRKEHRVRREKGREEDVFILFDTDVEYVVEKLSIDDLPATINGDTITWINNFSIKDSEGNYVNGVTYSLLMPPGPAKARLVIFDGATAAYYTGEIKDRTHNNKQFKEVRLNIGDPGGGWGGGST